MGDPRRLSFFPELEQALQSQVLTARPLAGGDINDSYEVTLKGGDKVFVKTHPRPPAGMYSAEANGLALLRDVATSMIVPEVVAQSENMLALSWLEPSPNEQSQAFGRALAELHQASGPQFPWGAPENGYIGSLPQDNSTLESWVDFYGRRRLVAQLDLSGARRLIQRGLRERFDSLLNALDNLLPKHPRPAVLHGDLWSGNYMATTLGPALFDPAAYVGHSEVDVAMMRLFGGFSQRAFAAYHELVPCEPGYQERMTVYQLYPLLVHVNLFGGGYVAQVDASLRRLKF